MTSEIINAEKKVFIISLIGTVITSTIGFIVFFISSSQAVLLDSLFSLFSALLSIISIWVVTVTSEKPSEDYPYGLTQAKPMLELFKAIVLLSFIIIAIFNSISSIIDGGSNLSGKIIVIYSLISVAISILLMIWIWLIGNKYKSSLIKMEIIQYFQDISISIGVGITFGLTLVFDHPKFDSIIPYLDSILVIVIGLLFTPSIIKIIFSSGRQLLLGSPSEEVRKNINAIVLSICKEYNVAIKVCYIIYSGGLIIVDTEVYYKDESWNWDKINSIRNTIEERIKSDYPSSLTSVSFYKYENLEHISNAST